MSLQDTLDAHRNWLSDRYEGGTRADLRNVNLGGTEKLHRARLRQADLGGASLSAADLSEANLRDANLCGADLTHADLRSADLRGANLEQTRLHWTILRGADLSGAQGLVAPARYLEREFETDDRGLLCYKSFGLHYAAPERWAIKRGSVIEENANASRTLDCACGVNIATEAWMEKENRTRRIWRCRIAWADLAGVVVPYGTDGKIRAERVRLLEKVSL